MSAKAVAKKSSFQSAKKKQTRFAYLLLIPFLVGFVLFFLHPFLLSFVYSINNVTLKGAEVAYTSKGFSYYYEALFINTNFRTAFISGIQDLLLTVPLILIFSLFIATILNKEFYGKNLSRIILFLPVIITTGVLLSVESTDYLISAGMSSTSQNDSVYTVNSMDLQSLLLNLNFPVVVMDYLAAIISKFYSILISSGVQITIFLAALQSIPPSLYEASAIEGATAWEDFWKITLPIVSPYIFVCALYSIVDTFSNSTNGIVNFIHKVAFQDPMNYGLSSAMAWIYFVVIALIIGLMALLFMRVNKTIIRDN